MPAWLISAMNLLGVGAQQLALTGSAVGGIVRRSRRRRALTSSDKADISFMAAVLGQPAAKQFALILASRPR